MPTTETFAVAFVTPSGSIAAGTATLTSLALPTSTATVQIKLIPPSGVGFTGSLTLTPVVPSANDTTILIGSTAALTDQSGNLWTITSAGLVAVNGVADTTTGNVVELAIVSNVIWQKNKQGLWYSKTSPSASWTTGTATSPLPAPAVAATPVFSPAAGTFSSAQTVSITTNTAGASIYYTTDGSTPTAASTKYSSPFTISASTKVKAISIEAGDTNSAVATAAYVISAPAATPTFSLAAGSYTGTQSVSLSTSTSGATIHYTTDGSTPTTSSPVYSGPISVAVSETINAIATAADFTTSAVASAAYSISAPVLTPASAPLFSLAAGSYTGTQDVRLSSATPGAAIYFTLDGSTPTSASSLYNSSIVITSSETVTAIAIANGFANSAVTSAAYVISAPVLTAAATPVFSLAPGSYVGAQSVTISSTTPGSIYYTTDGSTPTAASTPYTGAISIAASETVKAIVVASGFLNSAVASAAYTITTAVTPPPASALVVNESNVIAAANKIGMNLGNTNYYDGGQVLKNRLSTGQHPGFEPIFRRQIQQISSSTTSSFTTNNTWDFAPLNYWAGAKITILTGPDAGTVVTVTGNTAANESNLGPTYTFSPALSTALTALTVFKVENLPSTATPDAAWTNSTSWNRANGGAITTNSTDLPPNTLGIQAVTLDASVSGSSPTLTFYWDAADGIVFYLMEGTYTATIWAKAQSGSPVLAISCGRFGGFSAQQSYTLTNEWAEYVFVFVPNEVAATVPTEGCYFNIVVTGGVASIDDCSVVANNDTNPTIFTNAYMNIIAQGNFDAQRYWVGQEAETLDNWLKPAPGRACSVMGTVDPGYTSLGSNWVGLHEWLFMCQTAGNTRTTIVMPITFSNTEGANLVEYLAGAVTTPYGAKRAALGQSAPWTTVFAEINLEYGNEIWNEATPGVAIQLGNAGSPGSIWGYYDMLTPMFSAMRSNPSWSSVIKLVVTEQVGAWWFEQLTSAQLALIDKVDFAPYTQWAPTECTPASALFTPAFVECYGNSNNPNTNSEFYPAVQAVRAAGKTPLVYEFQNGTTGGAGTTAMLTGFPEGAAYGVANILEALEGMKFGAPEWNFFCLSQYGFGFNNTAGQSVSIKLWGCVVSISGALNRLRPSFLGLQAANTAILPNMLASTLSSPTFNFAASNGIAAESNVPYLTGYAFKSSTGRGVIFINSHLTETFTVGGISGMTAPAGAIATSTLTSTNPNDNNETSNVVALKEGTLASLSSSITVPPFSLVAVSWTVA